ncbi:hypothetical protein J2S74_002677 [Evansella vedderi]|uniref:Uncharacterized protein n=1 Tax=Evansella vedderi TaxID=38282 RepID=A0ABT9ZYW2_9BACI|nr:hypothetical protein [Evansella vedderi]MDQ0255295.1 hypothetical protein [Evansella vedderi]
MQKGKQELSELITLLGMKAEDHFNTKIKKQWNDSNVVKISDLALKRHLQLLKNLRKYSDVIALQLNLPTKQEVANIAKLAVQIEEKLDDLEEKLLLLTKDGVLENTEITQEKGKSIIEPIEEKQDNRQHAKEALRNLIRENLLNNSLNTNSLQETLEKMIHRRG